MELFDTQFAWIKWIGQVLSVSGMKLLASYKWPISISGDYFQNIYSKMEKISDYEFTYEEKGI